jgi:hypothetical protein
MKLKEKFSSLIPFYNVNDNNNKSIQCEKIADDYAIEFLEWVDENGLEVLWNRGTNKPKELLEIFKKEKGL